MLHTSVRTEASCFGVFQQLTDNNATGCEWDHLVLGLTAFTHNIRDPVDTQSLVLVASSPAALVVLQHSGLLLGSFLYRPQCSLSLSLYAHSHYLGCNRTSENCGNLNGQISVKTFNARFLKNSRITTQHQHKPQDQKFLCSASQSGLVQHSLNSDTHNFPSRHVSNMMMI